MHGATLSDALKEVSSIKSSYRKPQPPSVEEINEMIESGSLKEELDSDPINQMHLLAQGGSDNEESPVLIVNRNVFTFVALVGMFNQYQIDCHHASDCEVALEKIK